MPAALALSPKFQTHEALADLRAVPASELKNRFGAVIAQARKAAVAITRHQRAEFVLLPVERYLELQRAESAPLEALGAEFDAMVARMNAPAAKRSATRLFRTTPAALGKSAVKAARSARAK